MEHSTRAEGGKDSWKAYTSMATAFLALGQQAEAQVIYTDFDPDILLIGGNHGIDFDADGTNDLNILHISNVITTSSGTALLNEAAVNGEVIGIASSGYLYPSALASGVEIGSSDPNWGIPGAVGFLGIRLVTSSSTSSNGYWIGESAFLGCRFTVPGGGTHYGWVQLSVDTAVGSITIHGYAYESTPGLSIIAGNQGGMAAVADLEGPARLEVFPNPVKDLTTVRFGEALQGQVNVEVLDGVGRVLQQQSTTIDAERSMTLDLGALPAGTYFIAVRNNKRVLHRTVTKVE